MKYLLQLFRQNHWSNTAWGGDDKDIVIQRAKDIVKDIENGKWNISKPPPTMVRVTELLIELEVKD